MGMHSILANISMMMATMTMLSSMATRRRYAMAFCPSGRTMVPRRQSIWKSSSSSDVSAAVADVAASPTVAKPPRQKRVLSGVQPSGSLHLGNYLGAIRQWVDFQNDEANADAESFFCVVDMHAITQPQDPADLLESTLTSAALYLAAGIDPQKSKIFVQSHVSSHAELCWLLQCVTPVNWLNRMIQFKEKKSDSASTGLFTYPVLMAADILLYQASSVPVGEDQRQHLELARDICRRFTDQYGKGNPFKKRMKAAGLPSRPVFTEPTAQIVKSAARIMSLTDGTSKMSKSDPADGSRINILDEPKLIRNKIKRCKTDALPGLEWDNPERPEATNLLNIYQAVTGREKAEILEEVKDMKWGEFKPVLADAIIAHLEPMQKRYHEVREDPDYLSKVLSDGAEAADKVASQTLEATRVAMGFVPKP